MTEQQLKAIMIECAANGRRHQDYERTVNLAKLYTQIAIGLGQSELIINYKPSENEMQKKQRIEIYKSETEAVTSQIASQFNFVKGSARAADSISYNPERTPNLERLSSLVSAFWGKQTLQQYIEEKQQHYSFLDPNAWLIIQLDQNDLPAPICVGSVAALDYAVKGGITDYLVVLGTEGEYKKYYGYMKGFVLLLFPDETPIEGEMNYELLDISGKKYRFYTMPNLTDMATVNRFGYIPDDITSGRSFVGVLQPAVEKYKDLINQKSELDLSLALHLYPEKFQYVDLCDFRDSEQPHIKCDGGQLRPMGGQCPKCHGSGAIKHTTTQDVVLIKKPKGDDVKPMPLSELVHYSQKPLDIIKFQLERVLQIPKDIPIAIFGVDLNTRSTGLKTATEIVNFYDSIYMVLTPYAEKISENYIFAVNSIAQWLGISDGLIVVHKYPRRFKMESLGELLIMLKDAKTSGASSEVLWGIESQILEMQYKDNPAALELAKTKQMFKPFRHLNDAERMLEISVLPADNTYKILHGHLDQIFSELMLEQPKFLEFPYDKKRELVMAKAAELAKLFTPELPTIE